MIHRTPEADTEGAPTGTRRIEIDPPELPEWRIIVLGSVALVSGLALVVGVAVWLWTTPWAGACYLLFWCSWIGLKLEQSDD